jgi:hypothetical protein
MGIYVDDMASLSTHRQTLAHHNRSGSEPTVPVHFNSTPRTHLTTMRCAAFLAAVVFALPALAFDYGDIPINKAVRSNGYVVAFRGDLITKSPAAVSLCGESSLIRPRDGEIHYFYEKDHIAHLA